MGRNRPIHWNFREMRGQRKADHLCWEQVMQAAKRLGVLLAAYWCQISAFISEKQTSYAPKSWSSTSAPGRTPGHPLEFKLGGAALMSRGPALVAPGS